MLHGVAPPYRKLPERLFKGESKASASAAVAETGYFSQALQGKEKYKQEKACGDARNWLRPCGRWKTP
jgi:hypothetical protein